MRVLITGAGGQLGHDLAIYCASVGDQVSAFDRASLDIGDRDQVLGAVSMLRPDVVINAAAWTAVDLCESDLDRAFRDNALAVRWLREACDRADSHLVQVSTDYVFDGALDRPYVEWDRPNPQSVYGRSKLGGETEAGQNATIIRTSWVCGEHGDNMVKSVLQLIVAHDTLSFVDDQIGCPTFTTDLAVAVRRLARDRRPGVHHVTNQGAVSWFEFVRDIVASAGRDPEMVRPIKTVDLTPPRRAVRPANSVLDNAAFRLADIPMLRPYIEPLRELVSRLVD